MASVYVQNWRCSRPCKDKSRILKSVMIEPKGSHLIYRCPDCGAEVEEAKSLTLLEVQK